MKNYICTSEGFVKSAGYNQEHQRHEIIYTDKVREAQGFNTSTAVKFMERHEIKGFIWKPYAQEAVRDMYGVRKRTKYGYDEDDTGVEEWMVVPLKMVHDSDVSFLTSKKIKADDAMTFDEAKAEALRLNQEMFEQLNEKLKILINSTEP